jgi:hypothetical protein
MRGDVACVGAGVRARMCERASKQHQAAAVVGLWHVQAMPRNPPPRTTLTSARAAMLPRWWCCWSRRTPWTSTWPAASA